MLRICRTGAAVEAWQGPPPGPSRPLTPPCARSRLFARPLVLSQCPVPDAVLPVAASCSPRRARWGGGAGNEEGLGFSWFQASTDVSGLLLRGAHRWGYVLSHGGGQRLFKDTRQRFFVLLDHYMCYFDGHSPDVSSPCVGVACASRE